MNRTAVEQCRYHADAPARWHCQTCELALCTACKPMAELLPDDVICPLCSKTMTDTEIGAMFWQKPKGVLSYPLEPTSLVFIGGFALASLLVPAGFPTLVFGLVALVLFARYSWVILDRSSRGQSDPPSLRQLLSPENLAAFLDFTKVVLVYALPIALAHLSGSTFLLFIVVLLAGMSFPASVMAATIDTKLKSAFDYQRLNELVQTLGWIYVVVAGISVAVAVTPAAVFYPLTRILPTFVYTGVLALVYGYLAFVVLYLFGQTMYQLQRKLDFHAGVDRIDRPVRPRAEQYEPALALADARVQMAEGKSSQARLTVGDALTRYPRHTELNECFDRLIRETGEDSEFRNHMERRLRRLVNDGETPAAADLWIRNREHLGDWLPRFNETRYRLALELEKRGGHHTSLKLLLSLPGSDPKYVRLPEACLEAARMLEQHMGDSTRAEELRSYVRQRFPERAEKWLEEMQARQSEE